MYRELFLVVIISLTSTVLADVLVSGYEHQFGNNPHYSPLPQYKESTQQPGFQLAYPNYESHQDRARSHIVSYPYRHYHRHDYHYLPRPHHLHYAKVGGHGYVRPSVFVGYPQPLIVHHRYRRSDKSDPTSIETSKSAIDAHDDDVAAKSSLTDTEKPTIDSLLPEHEATNTNDKHLENRQINNDHMTSPRLFGLYPDMMYSGLYPSRSENRMQYMIPKNTASADKLMQKATSQGSGDCHDNFQITNRPSVRIPEPMEWDETMFSNDDYDSHSGFRNAWWFLSPFLKPQEPEVESISVPSAPMRFGPQKYHIYYKDMPPHIANLKDSGLDAKTIEDMMIDWEENTGESRAAQQEVENKYLQEYTNMNMASPRQSNTQPTIPIEIIIPKADQDTSPTNSPASHILINYNSNNDKTDEVSSLVGPQERNRYLQELANMNMANPRQSNTQSTESKIYPTLQKQLTETITKTDKNTSPMNLPAPTYQTYVFVSDKNSEGLSETNPIVMEGQGLENKYMQEITNMNMANSRQSNTSPIIPLKIGNPNEPLVLPKIDPETNIRPSNQYQAPYQTYMIDLDKISKMSGMSETDMKYQENKYLEDVTNMNMADARQREILKPTEMIIIPKQNQNTRRMKAPLTPYTQRIIQHFGGGRNSEGLPKTDEIVNTPSARQIPLLPEEVVLPVIDTTRPISSSYITPYFSLPQYIPQIDIRNYENY
ncbi:uncharacterized protein LOC114253988 [Monomorium pharaonis]|uniref:uncharacterized protein LOC114253988 n=1 Tax=Monomorium pharaonis TaxID=307658 RepID=UPI001745D159|nr:uncharacterized protein LOC114253988 [Monomorium pharaonis]